MKKNIKIYAEILEDEALKQFNNAMKLDCNVQGALMPDAHTGYTLPIGAVIKSKGFVFPSYVGYDIGCGMCAIKLDITKKDIDLEKLKNDILSKIHIGFERRKEPKKINLDYSKCSDILISHIRETAEYQIGTLGSGNHFIEIGESEKDGKLWIVIHSGSRGLGHKIASHYMELALFESIDTEVFKKEFLKGKEIFKEKNEAGFYKAEKSYIESEIKKEMNKKEGHYCFNIESDNGKNYLTDMEFCLNYALENRKEMITKIYESIFEQKVCKIDMNNFINRNHNHAELKDGFVIHRKGATHAEKNMMGVIPANMKDGSFIVKGLGNKDSMCSSSHGAGRVLSRSQAIKSLKIDDFKKDMYGIVTNHTEKTIDESPKAYKNIFDVMELQKDLVEIIDRSIPILNIKG